jgi:hypothetical protein
MRITRKDPFSRKTNTLDIPCTEEQLKAWRNGVLIQNAMPNLTPDEREFLMTGITADSWAKAFKNCD